jgi:hypothetical protein
MDSSDCQLLSEHSTSKENEESPTSPRENCVICLESIDLANKAVVKPCNHDFCFECIQSWVENSNTCPLCKTDITELQHTFHEDGNFSTTQVEAPAPRSSAVEDELQCLDHSYFTGEVNRLLDAAERVLRSMLLDRSNVKSFNPMEAQHLELMENVVCGLRNHKRRLQSMLHFDPHAMLQDLYRLQETMDSVYAWRCRDPRSQRNLPTSSAPAPRRYSAEDAWEWDEEEEEEWAEDMAGMNLGGKSRKKGGRTPKGKTKASPSSQQIKKGYKK